MPFISLNETTVERYVNYLKTQNLKSTPFALATGFIFDDENTFLTIYHFQPSFGHGEESYQFIIITQNKIMMIYENGYSIGNNITKLCDIININCQQVPDAYDFIEFWIDNKKAEEYENKMRKKYGFDDNF